jgi:uncharacterized protein (DUF1697 family)
VNTYISMLRGINVGGQKTIKMEELRTAYDSLGLTNARSYLQSGNIVFEHHGADPATVRSKIERKIKQSFGFDVFVLIRTRDELQRLVDRNPFTGRDEDKLHVTFLSEEPETFLTEELVKAKEGAEEFSKGGKEIYLFLPYGYGNTKLSNNFFERKLKVAATTRNWKTVNALLTLATE